MLTIYPKRSEIIYIYIYIYIYLLYAYIVSRKNRIHMIPTELIKLHSS